MCENKCLEIIHVACSVGFAPDIKVAGLIEAVLDPGLREQAEEHR